MTIGWQIPSPSAEYSDLVQSLKAVAPHIKPPVSGIPDEPDTEEYFSDSAPGFAHSITMTGTVYRYGGVPVSELANDERHAAIQSIIDSVYRYDMKPINHVVMEHGVEFTWKVAEAWHPAFIEDIFVHKPTNVGTEG